MKLIYPRNFPPGCIHHNNPYSSFHGLSKLWLERGYCEGEESNNPFFWVNKVGDILLYTWCTLEHLNPNQKYKHGLFANTDPPVNGRDNRPWTFWPRHNFLIEEYFKCKPRTWSERAYKCTFIGGYENLVQRGHRALNYWRPALDFYDFGIGGGNYTWQEYTRVLRNSRFGLCLRGSGPKCHREIECMSQGAVPILTPGCSLSYYDPIVPGKHCLFARSVEDVIEIVDKTTEKQWQELSWQARDWYWRNASPIGSFQTTKKIVERLSTNDSNMAGVSEGIGAEMPG